MKGIVSVFALFLSVTPALAQFAGNYTGWDKLSEGKKWGYVSGIVDWLIVLRGIEPEGQSLTDGMQACAMELKFSDALLAKQITQFYEQHPDRWVQPPVVIFWDVIVRGVCFSHVNKARATHGLAPFDKPE